jgi:hypothetical protein
MKIYLVYRTDEIGYDEYDSHVVIAKSSKRAKELCPWADSNLTKKEIKVKVKEIKKGKKERILLSSYNAG